MLPFRQDMPTICFGMLYWRMTPQLSAGSLPVQLPELLRLLLERLRNEITRLASVRAFTVLAGGQGGGSGRD